MLWRASILFWFTVSAVSALPVFGEVRKLDLPADFADFAIHPVTGDVAAVDAEDSACYFFKSADLTAGKTTPFAKAATGSTPCSVTFKKFGDLEVFAVVCTQDAQMHLFSAGDGSVVKRIDLRKTDVTLVTCSINPQDPFLYYCFGSGSDADCGVVSLRDMQNKGVVLEDAMDCGISASGRWAYRRGPFNSSGFESHVMTSSLDDEKPSFIAWHAESTNAGEYFPDPFDRFTASGSKLYDHTLDQPVASLGFQPHCYFRTRPIVFGYNASYNRMNPVRPPSWTLSCASYNSFRRFPSRVLLTVGNASRPAAVARDSTARSDYKLVVKRARVLADETRERLIVGDGTALFIVPLTEFDLPDEPFLMANLEGPTSLIAGEEHRFELKPCDDRVEVVCRRIPDGMQRDGLKFSWTPSRDQIGPASIDVTLKHGELERALSFPLQVAFPHLFLPFSPAGVSISRNGQRAVIWERPEPPSRGPVAGTARADGYRVAILELATGKTVVARQVSDTIGWAGFADEYVAIISGRGSSRCELLSMTTLESVKTIVDNTKAFVRVDAFGKNLFVQTRTVPVCFHIDTLNRIETAAENIPAHLSGDAALANTVFTPTGGVLNSVLLDRDGKPRLILAVHDIPVLPGANATWRPSYFPKATNDARLGQYRPDFNANDITRIVTLATPDGRVEVGLDFRSSMARLPNAAHGYRQTYEIIVATNGTFGAKQTIERDVRPAHQEIYLESARPRLVVHGNREAYVLHGRKLYQWTFRAEDENDAADGPKFEPSQSKLIFSHVVDQVVLEHHVTGGKTPLEFRIDTPSDALKIDATSGAVTMDTAAITREAVRAIETAVRRGGNAARLGDGLRRLVDGWRSKVESILGRAPDGLPVAIPIRVHMVDAAGQSDTLQYYVFIDLSMEDVAAQLEQLGK